MRCAPTSTAPTSTAVSPLLPPSQDEADALRFADNVQPYMPFRASVKRIDAFAAVALATDLNAHLHLEREGSLLIPPQTAVLLTDLERAAALAKDRYSVLEGAPWDAHRGLAAPTEIEAFGDGGRVGVVEGELSAIVEDDGESGDGGTGAWWNGVWQCDLALRWWPATVSMSNSGIARQKTRIWLDAHKASLWWSALF